MIEVEGLYHSYTNDERYAVKGVSFNIKEGEIFGFLGPNGAGKSTTQKVLTGLLPLQRGSVKIAGKDAGKPDSSFYNMIGVSFEQPNLYRKLTGLENLDYFAKMYDVPTEDPMELLRMVGLEEAASKRAGEYSKGMQQRLVFARSLINKPKIWFLDEPVSGLDPTTSATIKEIIKRKKSEGVTVFLTTHNMYIAEELCDRVAFIVAGEISLIDSPRNLKLQYGQKLVEVEYRLDGSVKKESFSLLQGSDKAKLNTLIEKGTIETMHSKEATLEEIFIGVTGRELR
ncbi:MAG TPA: ABC transporter ATP-binding protein [Mesotoga sp.]|jgi:fluoroquinolone transport system ATP-binding protein|nr:ABC transporter ATP-binding protein [Mesotoga sp.]MDI9374888.1 ABC transporter ATP-binding protein [Thermotogota bacterium]NLX34085.1 ABC transporter ATP-binding protein [Thermotogaceae bacterium]MDD4040612.1 ABC transporter ATP-binding protein [Mesotoga sp.]MDD4479177.1 ABC transporter ATP-binding protein [Mesotoga sp.]